jgi:hypothetical protein
VTIFVVKAGVALGLAWTSHGGSTLYIETLGGLSSFLVFSSWFISEEIELKKEDIKLENTK